MRNATTRQRGVTLRMLDFHDLPEQALDMYKQVDVDKKPWTSFRVGFEPWAAVEHDGHLFVVCVEGVGYEVTDDAPLEVDLYGHSDSGFGMLPAVVATLSPKEVRDRMRDEVDLADLIRSFGQRLEDNFALWHHTLTNPVEEEDDTP